MKPHDLGPELSLINPKSKDSAKDAIRQLKVLYLENNRKRYPNLPEAARVVPAYTDKSANGLTKCIIDYLRLNGHQAERISVTGRFIDKSKVVADCLGHDRVIGSGQWIKPTMQRGSADISATIFGRSVKIEVKIGKDVQSEYQKQYQQQIERAGGVYVIATSFDQFYNWFNNTFCNGNH